MRRFSVCIAALIILLAAFMGGCAQSEEQPGACCFTVTLLVRADALTDNLHLLDREMRELVPEDGLIFPATVVNACEGESAFDLLQREMRQAGIHMAFRNTPFYDSAYIIAIGNIFEFDAGELSGWMYIVNGEFPGVGSPQFLLSPGDIVEFVYTIDLGRDIGDYGLGGR